MYWIRRSRPSGVSAPDARHERPEGDGRHDEVAVAIPTHHGRGPATGREDALEAAIVDARGPHEVGDDLDDPPPDDDVAHELGGPGVDLAIALLPQPLLIVGGICRQARGFHSTSLGVDQSFEYARVGSPGPGGAALPQKSNISSVRGLRQRWRDPSSHSLKSSVSHRPKRPGGGRSGKSATSSWRLDRIRAVSSGTPRRRSKPLTSIGLPMRSRTRRPKPSQFVPLMATGTTGTPARRAKKAAPVVQGRHDRLADMDATFAGDGECSPGHHERLDPADRLDHVPFVGLVRHGVAGPAHQAVAEPDRHVGFLRPEEIELGRARQRGDQDQRVGPAEVVETEDAGPGRQPLAAFDAKPDEHADQDAGHEVGEARPERREPVRPVAEVHMGVVEVGAVGWRLVIGPSMSREIAAAACASIGGSQGAARTS